MADDRGNERFDENIMKFQVVTAIFSGRACRVNIQRSLYESLFGGLKLSISKIYEKYTKISYLVKDFCCTGNGWKSDDRGRRAGSEDGRQMTEDG